MKRIIIIGAGFAGLSALLALQKSKIDAEIILIDKDSHFEYTPSIHLLLADPGYKKKIRLDISKHYPEFRQEEVKKVTNKELVTDKGKHLFDYLVVATGSLANTFGNKSFEKHAVPFKRIADAEHMNKRLVDAKSVIVMGGGYTGVEIAAILAKETDKQIKIVEGRKHLIQNVSKSASRKSEAFMVKNGVELHEGVLVKECTKEGVVLDDSRKVNADLIINSAGIRPNDGILPDLDPIPDNIYLAGDVSKGKFLKTAHNAMIEGRMIGYQIAADIKGKEPEHVKHKDWQILAIALGKHFGLITFNDKAIPSIFTGFSKWIVEKRVMLEFKKRIMLPL